MVVQVDFISRRVQLRVGQRMTTLPSKAAAQVLEFVPYGAAACDPKETFEFA